MELTLNIDLPPTTLLTITSDTFGAIMAAVRNIDITMLMLVCRKFRTRIRLLYKGRIIKKSLIVDHLDEDPALFNYMATLNCKYTTENMLVQSIRTGRIDVLHYLVQRDVEIIEREHILLALKYNNAAFEYLMNQDDIGMDTRLTGICTDYETIDEIVKTINFTAIDAIIKHKKWVMQYAQSIVLSFDRVTLDYMDKKCSDIMGTVYYYDNLPIYQYLRNEITDIDIAFVIKFQAVSILKYMIPRMGAINKISKDSIISYAIGHDLANITNMLINNNIIKDMKVDMIYLAVMVKKLPKVCQLLGINIDDIAFINNIDDLFNHSIMASMIINGAAMILMTYAVANNYVITVEWLTTKYAMKLNHYELAISLGHMEIAALYKQ